MGVDELVKVGKKYIDDTYVGRGTKKLKEINEKLSKIENRPLAPFYFYFGPMCRYRKDVRIHHEFRLGMYFEHDAYIQIETLENYKHFSKASYEKLSWATNATNTSYYSLWSRSRDECRRLERRAYKYFLVIVEEAMDYFVEEMKKEMEG